jgi:GNAT superfamily N-acetyltransferase
MIRRYKEGEHVAIHDIFVRSIQELTTNEYTEQERRAWSEKCDDVDWWQTRCQHKQPFVYIIDEEPVGFIELDPDGHIDCAYVSPDHARKGVMSALMNAVKQEAQHLGLTQLYAEVSHTARPFFARHGFIVTGPNLVTVDHLVLTNWLMEYTFPKDC